MKHRKHIVGLVIGAAALLAGATAGLAQSGETPPESPAGETSCELCHANPDFFEADRLEIVEHVRGGVHAAAGLSCHDCHGGNPDPALAEDLDLAKDSEFARRETMGWGADNPYRGAPGRTDVAGFCGSCHSDPEYMRRFRPDLRVDQESEYSTSHHGQALAAGRTGAATCVDCHSTHGILSATDSSSPVYPTRVAETCRACHADAATMAQAEAAGGAALATDQYPRWRMSVHAAALNEKGDFFAPTCNDCHGNHGAAPPGVESIAFICGQCHGREARLFRASAKQSGYEEHDLFMEDAGDEGCAACHEPPETQAGFVGVGETSGASPFLGCATCHGHHAVMRPTLAMLGPLPEVPCAFCHEGSGPLAAAAPEAAMENYDAVRDDLVTAARANGFETDAALFDHLVDQALVLPQHTFPLAEEGGEPRLRPEFELLFEKFRIGKTAYTWDDPDSGEMHRVEVVRCIYCHGEEVELGDEPVGYRSASGVLSHMQELTAAIGRAERQLLAAQRGGVETRDAAEEIEKAVDAQIGLEVLVHRFEPVASGGAFDERQKEGMESATAALAAGRLALGELTFRHQGLAISLIFVLLLAIGLALKIRELSWRDLGGD